LKSGKPLRKFNIMKCMYALKVNGNKEDFFAFYSTLNKARSAGKVWLKKTNKIWGNQVSCEGIKFYELTLDIHKTRVDTDNDTDYSTVIVAAFTRRSSGPNGNNIITEEQP